MQAGESVLLLPRAFFNLHYLTPHHRVRHTRSRPSPPSHHETSLVPSAVKKRSKKRPPSRENSPFLRYVQVTRIHPSPDRRALLRTSSSFWKKEHNRGRDIAIVGRTTSSTSVVALCMYVFFPRLSGPCEFANRSLSPPRHHPVQSSLPANHTQPSQKKLDAISHKPQPSMIRRSTTYQAKFCKACIPNNHGS